MIKFRAKFSWVFIIIGHILHDFGHILRRWKKRIGGCLSVQMSVYDCFFSFLLYSNSSDPCPLVCPSATVTITVPSPYRHPTVTVPYPTVPDRPQPSETIPDRPQPSPTVPNRPQPSPTVPNRFKRF
jgi:hypothetical protein